MSNNKNTASGLSPSEQYADQEQQKRSRIRIDYVRWEERRNVEQLKFAQLRSPIFIR